MKKKLVIMGIVVLAVLVGAVAVRYMTNRTPTASPAAQAVTAEEAIQQAKNYNSSDRVCTQALTPATHTATGAKYTFRNGCLPDGWTADSQ